MQNYTYIKFVDDSSGVKPNKIDRLKIKLVSTILFFIPKANPDYDGKIGDVLEWQLEIEEKSKLPIREIGIDRSGKVLMIMPWQRNYGYWTDNSLTLELFISLFKATSISKDEFEENWEKFAGTTLNK